MKMIKGLHNPFVGEEQGGFTKGRVCGDQICTLRWLVENIP